MEMNLGLKYLLCYVIVFNEWYNLFYLVQDKIFLIFVVFSLVDYLVVVILYCIFFFCFFNDVFFLDKILCFEVIWDGCLFDSDRFFICRLVKLWYLCF